MRHCFYYTDLVQNAVFHNFSRQIAFIQYSGPSKHTWTFNQRNRSKHFQNHLYGQPVLTLNKCQICEEILKELRLNMIRNLLSLFFINGFITMCNLKKCFIYAWHFEYSCNTQSRLTNLFFATLRQITRLWQALLLCDNVCVN